MTSHLHVKKIEHVKSVRTTMVAGREVSTDDIDNYIVVFADELPHPETGELMVDHPIYIPPAAIANRMIAYQLESQEEALEAILKEHAVRLHGLKTEGTDKVTRMGGLHIGATISWAEGVSKESVLTEVASQVAKVYSERKLERDQ